MRSGERPRYLLIDALRGLAALAVVGFHAHAGNHVAALEPQLPLALRKVLEHGNAGVTMFFVISGFAIANTLVYKRMTPGYVGRFLARRSVRLDPPYWASMGFAILMGIAAVRLVPGKVYHLPTWTDILVHVAYLPDLLQRPLISDVYWTLCLEVQFYLSFSLLLVLVTKLEPRLGRERALSAVLWPAVAISNLWLLGLIPGEVPGLFIGFWYLFLTGVLVWRGVVRAGEGDFSHAAVAAAELLLLAGVASAHGDVPQLVAFATGALVLGAGLAGKLQTWLRQRPFQLLGAISYSLYLTHNQITGALFRVGYKLTGRTAAWEAFWMVAVVGACVGFAWLFFRLFEAPSIVLSKKIPMPDRTNVPPPAATPRLSPSQGAGLG